MITPANDGVTHINSYSKSRCEIGRMLSNFYLHNVNTPYGVFPSVEAYWSYLKTGNEHLKTEFDSSHARSLGQLSVSPLCDELTFSRLIYDAITLKLNDLSDVLLSNTLFTNITIPIIHKWVRDGVYVNTGSQKSVRILLDPIEAWRMRKVCLLN